MSMQDRIIEWSKTTSTTLEQLLAGAIILAVILFGLATIFVMGELDWQSADTFYELVYRVLLMVIGVELARTLLTHDLNAILELLAFVVARKMMKPDISSTDIVLSVISFVALLAGKTYFLGGKITPKEERLT